MEERWHHVQAGERVRLWVREIAGPQDSTPIVFHHGLASSQRIWDLLLPRLAGSHRLITFDARGHGRSGKPTSGYGFDHVVADTTSLFRSLGLRRPLLVGHSWGAMVALETAATHPRSVGGAVLIDGGIAGLRDHFSDWSEARRVLAPPHLTGTPVEEFRAMIRTFWGETVEITPEVETMVMSLMRVRSDGTIAPRLSRANHFRILHAIWDQDPIALHRRLQVPALAILAHADRDEALSRAKRSAAAAIREAGPSTRIVWVEGIHDLPLQQPDLLARHISRSARLALR